MKKFIGFGILLVLLSTNVLAQESHWKAGVDLYNTYVWRGTKFGEGAAVQPNISYSVGGLSVGAWGSYSLGNSAKAGSGWIVENPYVETDVFASYSIKFCDKSSMTLSVTDYYYPDGTNEYLNCNYHYVEPSVQFNFYKFSLLGAYMTKCKDKYVEANANFKEFTIFAGAGDGMYTKNGKFNVCNTGIKTVKSIKVNENFILPLTGGVVFNPSTESFHIIVGLSI